MENLAYNLNFNELSNKLSLGSIIDEPKQISGGLLHLMFQLKTDRGCYAVKALNPQIMQRETAMGNYIFSEKVVNKVADSGINALPAISVNGNSIHKVDGQYYLVFSWVDGKALKVESVDRDKCRMIGELLARIHQLDFSSISSNHENKMNLNTTNWNMLFEKARKLDLIWANEFKENPDTLYKLENQANAAILNSFNEVVICHRDLDPKNVLWDDAGKPMIIDWEAAGYMNPSLELLEVALYWSGDEKHDKELFCAVIDAYIENGGTMNSNKEDTIYSVFKGKLQWLEYNMKRSLRIECSSEEEQKLGTKEVVSTMQSINAYSRLIPDLLYWLR
ncbi:phosphotransferase enzyme family protein [Vallitalea okinawensis]|uniref:phosphotransferase enzyme family protein n=1 Tax=Vallitalea okinawensis TaxID=2078660 RepID=UPI000CFDEE6E|nr:aminoglycoside phosphotransferase family protein [Vallitalea okinawensis]